MTAQDLYTDLYTDLCAKFPGTPSAAGWVALDECPVCRHVSRNERDRASAFSQTWWKCQVCGESGNLFALAEALGVPVERRDYVPRPASPPPPPKNWQTKPDAYLERFLAHPRRVDEWTEYRPFSLDTIARWQLGVGVLPNSPCRHTRLIYPVYHDKLVAFRGRHWGCECEIDGGKWITAGGGVAALWGRELLRPGATVFVMEAPPDAMFCIQKSPDKVAVAGTAGANTWRDSWTQAIVESKPELVVVAYDNDLAGMARGDVRDALLKEWWAAHPKAVRPPRAGGWWVLDKLLRADLPAVPWDWSPFPPKFDMGDVFMEEMR